MVERHQPLPDSQWQVIAWLLPAHRKRRHCLRQVLDAMRYSCRTDCQWRNLPRCFPPWLAVYYYFRRWQCTGLWQRLTNAVNQADRVAAGRRATPSLVCLDSQSVRLAPRIFEHRGLDGGKHVNGRTRQLLTAVQGRILACRVHAANGHDGREARRLLPQRPSWGARLLTVVTDKSSLTRGIGGALPTIWLGWDWCTSLAAGLRAPGASCPWLNAGWWSAPSPGSPASDD